MNKDRLYQDFMQLLHVPGISGTRSEVLTAEKVLSLLEEMPYFQSHPALLSPLISNLIRGRRSA